MRPQGLLLPGKIFQDVIKIMKNIFKKISLLILMFLIMAIPFFWIQAAKGDATEGSISNPLNADSFSELIQGIINWVIIIGQSIAVIMIIWSGFLFMTSEGDPEKISKAKKSLTWALVGLLVLLIGDGFIGIVKDLLGT